MNRRLMALLPLILAMSLPLAAVASEGFSTPSEVHTGVVNPLTLQGGAQPHMMDGDSTDIGPKQDDPHNPPETDGLHSTVVGPGKGGNGPDFGTGLGQSPAGISGYSLRQFHSAAEGVQPGTQPMFQPGTSLLGNLRPQTLTGIAKVKLQDSLHPQDMSMPLQIPHSIQLGDNTKLVPAAPQNVPKLQSGGDNLPAVQGNFLPAAQPGFNSLNLLH